jgi:hypothetical protein
MQGRAAVISAMEVISLTKDLPTAGPQQRAEDAELSNTRSFSFHSNAEEQKRAVHWGKSMRAEKIFWDRGAVASGALRPAPDILCLRTEFQISRNHDMR